MICKEGVAEFITLRPRPNDRYLADDIFKCIFLMKMNESQLRYHWSLFLRVKLTIFQYWFRWWLCADQATCHYLNQWWLVYWRIYASLGLNELYPWSGPVPISLGWRRKCIPFHRLIDWMFKGFVYQADNQNISKALNHWPFVWVNHCWHLSVVDSPQKGPVLWTLFPCNDVTMMTSSNGNIFRVTGLLCGEFTGPRWIPRTKASDAELWCLLWSTPE